MYEKIHSKFLGKAPIEEVEVLTNTLTVIDKWKIALARAFLCSPRVLLVDDLGDDLGQDEEEELYDLLFEYYRTNRSRLNLVMVGRKMQTVKMADRIFVLEAGRIADSGNRDTIIEELKKDGRYANILDA